jgi:hypothetical protein
MLSAFISVSIPLPVTLVSYPYQLPLASYLTSYPLPVTPCQLPLPVTPRQLPLASYPCQLPLPVTPCQLPLPSYPCQLPLASWLRWTCSSYNVALPPTASRPHRRRSKTVGAWSWPLMYSVEVNNNVVIKSNYFAFYICLKSGRSFSSGFRTWWSMYDLRILSNFKSCFPKIQTSTFDKNTGVCPRPCKCAHPKR